MTHSVVSSKHCDSKICNNCNKKVVDCEPVIHTVTNTDNFQRFFVITLLNYENSTLYLNIAHQYVNLAK